MLMLVNGCFLKQRCSLRIYRVAEGQMRALVALLIRRLQVRFLPGILHFDRRTIQGTGEVQRRHEWTYN